MPRPKALPYPSVTDDIPRSLIGPCDGRLALFLQRYWAMRHYLDRYSPEICAQLRKVAEQRDWHAWDNSVHRDEILEDLELTYHLHLAAEATSARAGLPAMPTCHVVFIDSEGILDPAAFLRAYKTRHNTPCVWNQSDSGAHAALMA